MMIRFKHDHVALCVTAEIFPHATDGKEITAGTCESVRGIVFMPMNDERFEDVMSNKRLRAAYAAVFALKLRELRRAAFNNAVWMRGDDGKCIIPRHLRVQAFALYQDKYPCDWPHLAEMRKRRRILAPLVKAAEAHAARAVQRDLRDMFSLGKVRLAFEIDYTPFVPRPVKRADLVFTVNIGDLARYFDMSPQAIIELVHQRNQVPA